MHFSLLYLLHLRSTYGSKNMITQRYNILYHEYCLINIFNENLNITT